MFHYSRFFFSNVPGRAIFKGLSWRYHFGLILSAAVTMTCGMATYAVADTVLPGKVIAWGDNAEKQTSVPELKNVKTIAAGGYHSLALNADGTVVAWGRNDYGQGAGLAGLKDVKAIAAGEYHNLALKTDGTVVFWGYDTDEQKAGAFKLTDVKAIAAGASHSLALKNDGTVVAWGDDYFGLVTGASALTDVKAISAGYSHDLALKNDGTVVAWGNNGYDQVTGASGLTGVTAISAGGRHNLAKNLTSTPTYTLGDFLPPVNKPDFVNFGKAGRTYPIKWQLKDAAGKFVTSLAAIKSITFKPAQCGEFTSLQANALEAETSGNSGLIYDDISNQYRYNWTAPSAGCYVLYLNFDTGQEQKAYFNLRN